MFEQFNSWEEVLVHVAKGYDIYYHPPLDRLPSKVVVVKQFKNGKLRVRRDWSFTIDSGHLNRIMYRS